MIQALLSIQIIILGMGMQPPEVKKAPSTEEVRTLARGTHFLSDIALIKYGAAAFPACEAILADPKSTVQEISGVLSAVIHIKAPKAQFLDLTVPLLAHKNISVRNSAVGLMEQIGTPAEGAILVALLSDEHRVTAVQAATALSKIGGARDVVAMDAWLLGGTAYRDDDALLRHVKSCRDALEKRLKAKPTPKDAKN